MASLTQYSIGSSFISKKSLRTFSNISKTQLLNYQQKSRLSSSLILSSSRSGRKSEVIKNVGKKSKGLLDQWRIWCHENGSCRNPPMFSPHSVIELIQEFYKAINAKDKNKVEQLLSEDCRYHDIIFYDHFQGKENVAGFIYSVMDSIGPNIHAVIDVTEGHDLNARATGHLEWKNIKIPFTTGCRVFECEEIEEKLFIRNITGVEQLQLKPGSDVVLKLLKAVSTLFDLFPLVAEGLLHGMKSRDTHERT